MLPCRRCDARPLFNLRKHSQIHLIVIKDIENNNYEVVIINHQTWSASNLRTKKFRNGEPIKHAVTIDEWEYCGNNGISAWCYYNNNPENELKFGLLYNWFAVIDERGLCPTDTRIPSKQEWEALLKIPNTDKSKLFNNFNSNSGYRCEGKNRMNDKGEFFALLQYSMFWSSSQFDYGPDAWGCMINEQSETLSIPHGGRGMGLSVRFIIDKKE